MVIDAFDFEYEGLQFRAEIHHDPDHGAPWDESDGHGPVSDWRRKDTKRPSERVLHQDHDSCRFYDYAEAVRIAKRDGWGSAGDEGLSKGEKAVRAVERDFEYLRAWCNDDWHYVGVVVILKGFDYDASLWGIESNADEYIRKDVAPELAAEALSQARAGIPGEIAALQTLQAKLEALDA